MPARRVTPMLMVADVAATVAHYERQGFRAIATDEPECEAWSLMPRTPD
jgi:hypothetical protein